jgi:hypothetical protein
MANNMKVHCHRVAAGNGEHEHSKMKVGRHCPRACGPWSPSIRCHDRELKCLTKQEREAAGPLGPSLGRWGEREARGREDTTRDAKLPGKDPRVGLKSL